MFLVVVRGAIVVLIMAAFVVVVVVVVVTIGMVLLVKTGSATGSIGIEKLKIFI